MKNGDADGCLGCCMVLGFMLIVIGVSSCFSWPIAIIGTGVALVLIGIAGATK